MNWSENGESIVFLFSVSTSVRIIIIVKGFYVFLWWTLLGSPTSVLQPPITLSPTERRFDKHGLITERSYLGDVCLLLNYRWTVKTDNENSLPKNVISLTLNKTCKTSKKIIKDNVFVSFAECFCEGIF